MQKDFERWGNEKARLHETGRGSFLRAGEIRWAAIGVNVGSEIDGKGEGRYTRPVLVLDVFGKHLALVVPVSIKLHDHPGYLHITIGERTMALCVHQIRVLSQKRIFNRKSKLSNTRLQQVRNSVRIFWHL